MKHLLSLTLIPAILLFAGCHKDNVTANSSEAGLSFNLMLDGIPVIETRAANTDADLKSYGFYLAGYHTDGNMESSVADAYPNVFDHDALDKQAPVPLVKMIGSAFTLKTIKWALSEMTYLSFFAWSQSKPVPVSGVTPQTTGIYAHTSATLENGYPWIDIRNADIPTDQTDVVVSRSLDHQNDAVISAVDLDFQHILSKLTFKAKSSSKANITFTAVNIKYATNKVYKRARYTFSSGVTMFGAYGAFAEYHAGSGVLNTNYPAMTNGAEVALGSALLVPQALAAGDVSLEIRYRLSPNSDTVQGVEQTKTLPFSAFAFEQGKNYVYTIDVQATGIFVLANPTIEPWNIAGTSLPVVPGLKSDALLLLDGYDRPYQHTDGKWYWLDRSGYNRHVELGTGFASYDDAKHGYVFKKEYAGSTIPYMDWISGLTVDLVAECTGTAAEQKLFTLGSFYLLAPSATNNGNVNWKTLQGEVIWSAPLRADVIRQSFWSVTYGNERIRTYYNAELKAEKAVIHTNSALMLNTLATSYDGRISYLKITNNERTEKDIVADYQSAAKRFNVVKNTYLPPVTAGLIFCFDGRHGLSNINNTIYWRNLVSANDAKMVGTVPFDTDHFTFPAEKNATNYLELTSLVAMPNNFTVEIVLRSRGASSEGTPVLWRTKSGSDNSTDRMLSFYIPWPNPANVYIDSPGTDRFFGPWQKNTWGEITSKRQITLRREYKVKSELYLNNQVGLSGTANDDISAKVCADMRIGHVWNGDFYMLRVYDRKLTDAELKQNYDYNKAAFNF